MANQLDCTTSIASTQNNGIHGIHFGPQTTSSRLSRLASKRKPWLFNISGVDWTTTTSNHPNQQVPYESSSQNSISGSAMIVRLKMIHIFLEHYTTGIFSNVSSSFWHISHFRCTSILNRCASLTLRAVKFPARWTWAIGGGIHRINFLPERQLCQSYVHQIRLAWPTFWAISMPGRCISQLAIFEKISAGHPTCAPGFLLGWSPVPQKVPKTLTKHGIQRLELCCLNLGILTSLSLAWNGIVLMDSSDNVTLCWLPGSGIIRNKSWLLKSHMAHTRCVKFLKVYWWGIDLFDD